MSFQRTARDEESRVATRVKGEGGCVTGTNVVKPQRALIKHYVGPNVSHRDDGHFCFRLLSTRRDLILSIASFNKGRILVYFGSF